MQAWEGLWKEVGSKTGQAWGDGLHVFFESHCGDSQVKPKDKVISFHFSLSVLFGVLKWAPVVFMYITNIHLHPHVYPTELL